MASNQSLLPSRRIFDRRETLDAVLNTNKRFHFGMNEHNAGEISTRNSELLNLATSDEERSAYKQVSPEYQKLKASRNNLKLKKSVNSSLD